MKATQPRDVYLLAVVTGLGTLCGIALTAAYGFKLATLLPTVGCGFMTALSLWIALTRKNFS